MERVLVTGGAGYVGAVLVPKLLARAYQVRVLDLYIYGGNVLQDVTGHPHLEQFRGDIRDRRLLDNALQGVDVVIHLACISNDPSYELNPELGKSVNYDGFVSLVGACKAARIAKFIFASSSSVYGVKTEPEVTEDLALEPLTDYSKYKAACEKILLKEAGEEFVVTIVRPATVCGYSSRLRLDLTVNILTNHAVHKGTITVFGGRQKRPNIHIDDITDLYVFLLEQPAAKTHRKIYNAGYENFTVSELAEKVRRALGGNIEIVTTETDDNRSYHVSSRRLNEELGFAPKRTIEDAVLDLKRAFDAGLVPNALDDPRYYNIRTMQRINLV